MVKGDGARFIANLPSLRACLASDSRPLPSVPRPTYAVTSLTGPFAATAAARSPPWRDTLWHGRHKPALVPRLLVYHENSQDVIHGRPAVKPEALPFVDCTVDTFHAAPRLQRMLAPRRAGMFESFYNIRGTLGLSDNIMDGKALVKKMVAIASSAQHLPAHGALAPPSTRAGPD